MNHVIDPCNCEKRLCSIILQHVTTATCTGIVLIINNIYSRYCLNKFKISFFYDTWIIYFAGNVFNVMLENSLSLLLSKLFLRFNYIQIDNINMSSAFKIFKYTRLFETKMSHTVFFWEIWHGLIGGYRHSAHAQTRGKFLNMYIVFVIK